ncbi:MAG: ribonuclease P protein component, partial [Alicyclobacillus sp.]|nr:ribonuclease P protein component [Alicyclobacillus sp.]
METDSLIPWLHQKITDMFAYGVWLDPLLVHACPRVSPNLRGDSVRRQARDLADGIYERHVHPERIAALLDDVPYSPRLMRACLYQAVLSTAALVHTAHFALHGIATGGRVGARGVPLFPGDGAWLGAVIPKRWARRAVTRNALKRQIYAAEREHPLPPGAQAPAQAGLGREDGRRRRDRVPRDLGAMRRHFADGGVTHRGGRPRPDRPDHAPSLCQQHARIGLDGRMRH